MQVFCITGPTGAGRQSLAQLLLRDFPKKLAAIPLLTSRKAHTRELPARQQQQAPCKAPHSCSSNIASSSGSKVSSSSGDMAVAHGAPVVASGPSNAMGPPGGLKWEEGSKQLLRFMSDGDLHKLEVMGLLVGKHESVGCSYATSRHLLEQVWAEGLVALLVGPWQLGRQLKEDLGADVQVGCLSRPLSCYYIMFHWSALDFGVHQHPVLCCAHKVMAFYASLSSEVCMIHSLLMQ
jgi:hypothetical protein